MEWQKTGKISLKDFWIRRVRRIIPAMLLLLATVYLLLILLDPSRIGSLQGDFISTVFYYNNWWKIFHNVSYFESFGPQSPIGHLWSLAIEEQFYILWPAVLTIGLHFAPKRRKLILIITAGAIASMLAMGIIYEPGADPSRVYYGTDTRAFALLIGAVFAIGFPSSKLPKQISVKQRLALDIIGVFSLIGILITVWRTNEYQSSLYVGGLAIFSVLSAIVVVVLAHPAGGLLAGAEVYRRAD
jgi:peptidoglycan/LPS O-acetylase OafA/YrhL